MELFKSDLFKLGNSAFRTEDGTCIVCRCEGSFMETIFVRECLKLFGNYSIIKEEDICYENGECEWGVYTNFPWDEYVNLNKTKP